ncbi:MAG: Trp biosynthesis-associated membrane protein [Marmoricola sp.]
MPDVEARSPRRTFGPVVLLGLATAGMAAVAAGKPWVESGSDAAGPAMSTLDSGTRYPLGSAVSLVLLAAWGVLLVTRGWVRRAFAVVAAVAAVALVGAVVAAYVTLPDSAQSSFDELMGRGVDQPSFTGWFWTAAVCSVLALVPAFLAVRLVSSWPEMGSRYDAPGAASTTEAEPAREQDLWKALDEGRDPTDTNRG